MNQADRTRAKLNGLLERIERLANERLGITNEPEPTPTPPGKTAKRLAEFDAMSDEKQIAKLLELFR
jgi:ribosomal protein S12 methylthiotransferase accessory factor YcaO